MSSFYSTSNASSEGGRASPLATQCGFTLPNEEPMQLQKSLSTSSFASLEYSKPVSALSRSLAPDSNLRLSVLPRTFSASPCISETASGLDTSRSSVDTPDCLPRPTSSSAECYSGRAGSIPIDVPNTWEPDASDRPPAPTPPSHPAHPAHGARRAGSDRRTHPPTPPPTTSPGAGPADDLRTHRPPHQPSHPVPREPDAPIRRPDPTEPTHPTQHRPSGARTRHRPPDSTDPTHHPSHPAQTTGPQAPARPSDLFPQVRLTHRPQPHNPSTVHWSHEAARTTAVVFLRRMDSVPRAATASPWRGPCSAEDAPDFFPSPNTPGGWAPRGRLCQRSTGQHVGRHAGRNMFVP
eukprot:gene8988-16125_t